MTKQKILYILEKEGYSLDSWTDLRAFSFLTLKRAENCFTDKETRKLKFNSSTNCLEVVLGELKDDGNFYSNGISDSSKFIPNFIYDFDSISGFIQSIKK